jgi:3D (Asp-Asp-Asp) domain-containing protein
MGKSLYVRLVIVGFALGFSFYVMLAPQAINADLENSSHALSKATLIHNGHLTICKMDKEAYETIKSVTMMITAYSSTPEETDDDPFITASGRFVEDGIVANNMLPFGTKIRIPELYGDKVFTVADRMHRRKGKYHADIWFSDTQEAKEFGAKISKIEILES